VEFTSSEGEERYAALVAHAADVVVGLDFDGTLAPIVDDPESAHIHPDAAQVLTDLAGAVRAVAVVTGRPARQALALGGLDEVGDAIGGTGRELYLFGQYGNERWSSTNRRVITPRPPQGLATFERELPRVLKTAGAADAFVEDKGLAVAVHTRRLDDPAAAQERLTPVLERAAARYGLVTEPGRMVVEIRASGMDKGNAVRTLQKELRADAMMFVGDDLGDVEAFDAVADLRRRGMVGFLVCAGSDEQHALVERADLVVDGPDGVMDLLRRLSSDITSSTP
jgi:trehalose 6-phosphate phosphatase